MKGETSILKQAKGQKLKNKNEKPTNIQTLRKSHKDHMEFTLCWPTTPRHNTYPAVCDILTDTQLKKNGFSFLFGISGRKFLS